MSIYVGGTNVQLTAIGQYMQQGGPYPLNGTRPGQQTMWIHADPDPTAQGDLRKMSRFQQKTLTYVQGGGQYIYPIPTIQAPDQTHINIQTSQALYGAAGSWTQPSGGNALTIQTPGPTATAYTLLNFPGYFYGGGGAGGQGQAGTVPGAGGTGGAAISVQGGGTVYYQGNYTATNSGGGGGGGGAVTYNPPGSITRGGGGGGGVGYGAGGQGGPTGFNGVGGDATGTSAGQGGFSPGPNAGGNGGGFNQAGQPGFGPGAGVGGSRGPGVQGYFGYG